MNSDTSNLEKRVEALSADVRRLRRYVLVGFTVLGVLLLPYFELMLPVFVRAFPYLAISITATILIGAAGYLGIRSSVLAARHYAGLPAIALIFSCWAFPIIGPIAVQRLVRHRPHSETP
jgi:hypothetical protein